MKKLIVVICGMATIWNKAFLIHVFSKVVKHDRLLITSSCLSKEILTSVKKIIDEESAKDPDNTLLLFAGSPAEILYKSNFGTTVININQLYNSLVKVVGGYHTPQQQDLVQTLFIGAIEYLRNGSVSSKVDSPKKIIKVISRDDSLSSDNPIFEEAHKTIIHCDSELNADLSAQKTLEQSLFILRELTKGKIQEGLFLYAGRNAYLLGNNSPCDKVDIKKLANELLVVTGGYQTPKQKEIFSGLFIGAIENLRIGMVKERFIGPDVELREKSPDWCGSC